MSPKAPFIIVGAVNLIVMLGGLWLRARVTPARAHYVQTGKEF